MITIENIHRTRRFIHHAYKDDYNSFKNDILNIKTINDKIHDNSDLGYICFTDKINKILESIEWIEYEDKKCSRCPKARKAKQDAFMNNESVFDEVSDYEDFLINCRDTCTNT